MAANRTTAWLGYAPAALTANEYAVRYHPRLGRRVSCLIRDRENGVEITLYSRVPHPEIESQIPDGGPFFVNEWKQVLKPAQGEDGFREVFYLGEFPHLHFEFTFRGTVFDNASSDGLSPGDAWAHPEVGMRYKYDLSAGTISREMVTWDDYAAVHETETLDGPSPSLLRALGQARPGRRAGRLYVNEHGIVFLPATNEAPTPLYVTRINVETDPWFEKHEPDAQRG